jgi:hypothetical protein
MLRRQPDFVGTWPLEACAPWWVIATCPKTRTPEDNQVFLIAQADIFHHRKLFHRPSRTTTPRPFGPKVLPSVRHKP